jgi:hypothetical protein
MRTTVEHYNYVYFYTLYQIISCAFSSHRGRVADICQVIFHFLMMAFRICAIIDFESAPYKNML